MVLALRRCGGSVVWVVLLAWGLLGATSAEEGITGNTPNTTAEQQRYNKPQPTATQEGLGSWSATVYVDAVDGSLVVKEGVLDEEQGLATALFDTTGRATSGWAELVLRRGLSPKSTDTRLLYRAFGVLEGMLTCGDIAPFRANALHALFPPSITDTTDDKPQPVPPEVLSFLRANEAYMRDMTTQHQHTDPHWEAVGVVLSQFDGLVEGYGRSRCFPQAPLSSIDLLVLQSYGDLFDLLPALSSLGPIRQRTHANPQIQNTQERWRQQQPSPPRLRAANTTDTPRLRAALPMTNTTTTGSVSGSDRRHRHRCTAAVLLTDTDISFGHATWDAYALLWPRVYKTLHLSPSAYQSFSSSPALLSSLDDFYLIHGSLSHPNTRLALIESSYEMLEPRKFAPLLSPTTLPCWVRIMVANALASDGQSWAELFGTHNSGTYNTNWLVLDMNRVQEAGGRGRREADKESFHLNGEDRGKGNDTEEGEGDKGRRRKRGHAEDKGGKLTVGDGFATLVETMPGHVGIEDVTSVLRDKRVMGLYNVPYTQSVRDLYGYSEAAKEEPFEFDYWQVPRAKQLAMLREKASEGEGLDGMAWLLGYNDPTDTASKGHAMDAIAARGDLEEVTDVFYYWEGGALDGKASSYRSAFSPPSASDEASPPLVLGRVGPSADQRPVFCWDQRGSLALRRMSHEAHPPCFTFKWAPVGRVGWEPRPMQVEVPAFWN